MRPIAPKIALILFLSLGICASAQEHEKLDQLQFVKEELESKRAEYEELEAKEQDQLRKLRLLEEQIALSGQLILKIEREVVRIQREINEQQLELGEANRTLKRKKGVLYGRLRYTYKVGNRLGWLDMITSANPTEALTALKNMKTILEYDRHLIESYNRLSGAIDEGIVGLRDARELLLGLKGDYESELKRRKTTLETRKRLLERLRKDRSAVERSLDRLEEDTKLISGIFDELDVDESTGTVEAEYPGLENKKGDLIWPVNGEIVRSYGTSKDKRGIKLTNPGIDIKASFGSRVNAAASGIVIYSSWLRGYGQFIIVDHGQKYYTLYANLGSVMVDTGDRVKAGQSIALVGDSGTLEGSRLHFEIRHGRQQMNPVDWLR
jgi:septal ring factor EnvC (AmiA/AmiB activator)